MTTIEAVTPLARELAAALRPMPCTCVKRSDSWPFKVKEHEDRVCRRCVVLAKFDAIDQVKTPVSTAVG